MGPFDRDEPLLNHRPFLVLADYLAHRGVAALRYDLRGVGKSSGKFAGVTRSDLAGDVKAAVAYLRGRPEIAPRGIGLLGHMDGGRTAAMAAGGNPDVSFLAVLSMSSVSAWQAFAERNLLNAQASGGSYAAAEEQAVTDRKVAALIAEAQDAGILEQKLREVLKGTGSDEDITTRLKQLTSPGFQNFLNLLLQTTDTGLGREAFWAEETMAPVALETIADWVLKVSNR